MEVLAKKKRSVKRKPQASLEGCPPTRGKALKAGTSSSPSSAVGAGGFLGGEGGLSPPWRFFLFRFGVPRRRAVCPLLKCQTK